MIEVHPRLWVGDDADAEILLPAVRRRDATWALVSAAKEPHHRALVGYTGRAAPAGDEYYAARRGRHLALNWVDVDDPRWFREEELDLVANFIRAAHMMELDVLVHCNQGASRSPALVLWWLHQHAIPVMPDWLMGFDRAEEKFRIVYPKYDPTEGVRTFVRENW